jgi:hypothetical protein
MAALRFGGRSGEMAFSLCADSWVSSDSLANVGEPAAACWTLTAKWLRVTLGELVRDMAALKQMIEGS